MKTLRRLIHSAIPTCTLWEFNRFEMVWYFRPYRKIYVTELERIWLT